ncbi:MAG TPA: hypothetical protein VF268_00595 [Gammaproteobacteria bacterium]
MADKLKDFIGGFTAAIELYNRAGKIGAFIESVCLAASIIEASLRMGLVLKHQINMQSSDILDELLFQGEEDKVTVERKIYDRALHEGVINQKLFSTLEELYKDRNRVVHRYIISELTTEEVLSIAIKYDKAIQDVSSAVEVLENEQIQRGIGITRSDIVEFDMKEYFDLASNKHGKRGFVNKLRDNDV